MIAELDERDQIHAEELQRVAEEWRDEVEDAKEREREARQVRRMFRCRVWIALLTCALSRAASG